MVPNPGEEGLGRRAGSFDLFEALVIPNDPRGIVLACGFVALAAIGINGVVVGDWIGFGYLLSAAIGYFFVQTRFVPAVLWLLVALGGLLGATAGNPSNWIVAGLGAFLAVVSIFRPGERDQQPTSRKPEVGAALPQLQSAPAEPHDNETSNLEVGSLADGANGHAETEVEVSEAAVVHTVPSSAKSRIALRTMGSLCIELDCQDQTQRLRAKPRLEFLLSYLVARWVLTRDFAVDRAAIALEMAPDVAATSQRDRLRKTLHAFRTALGPDLKGRVRVTASQVRFDLTGVDIDFVALAEMASRVNRRRGLIDASLAEDVRGLLEAASGEFLTGFSDLEHQVTEGKGGAHQLVEDARLQIGEWKADLAAALARHLEAAGQPQSSIVYLQPALAQSPRREDLARLLVAAYMQTGQIARADEIRLDYGLSAGEAR